MKYLNVLGMVLLVIFVVVSCKQAPQEISPSSEELVSFVERAVELIETEGEAAFPKFRERDTDWFSDNLYIFVWGLDGMRYVYPPDPQGEGKNMLDLQDATGKPIGRLFVEAVSGETGEGWVSYMWPEPDSDEPIEKNTFLKKAVAPSGIEYLVGSGIYE